MSVGRKSQFKFWEMVLLALGALLFAGSLLLFMTDYPLVEILFGVEEINQNAVGQVSRADGSLRRERSGQATFAPVRAGSELYARDMIVTGANSHATLALEDGSVIDLAPGTMIRLEGESKRDLIGVSRTLRVRIVNGEVKTNAESAPKSSKTKVVIIRHDEEIDLSETKTVKANAERPMAIPKPVLMPKAAPAPVAPLPPPRPSLLPAPAPSPKAPLPTLPSPSPSPSPVPSATPLLEPRVVLLSPKEGSRLSVPKSSRTPDIVAPIEISLAYLNESGKVVKAASLPPLPVKVRVYLLNDPGGKGSLMMDDSASVSTTSHGQFKFQPNVPGRYRVIVSRDGERAEPSADSPRDDSPLARSEFTVSPDFEGIALGQPEAFVDRSDPNEFRKSGVRLSWSSYPGVTDYQLKMLRKGKPDEQVNVSGTSYSVKRDQNQEKERLYTVSANLAGGWRVHSMVDRMVFDFTPPTLVTPANHNVLGANNNMWEGKGVLLTWQKTGVGDSYFLTIAEDSSFRHVLVRRKQEDNFLVFRPGKKEGTFFWRVQALEGETLSRPSEIFDFTVKLSKGQTPSPSPSR